MSFKNSYRVRKRESESMATLAQASTCFFLFWVVFFFWQKQYVILRTLHVHGYISKRKHFQDFDTIKY
jgi:hypothetical protein